MGGGEGGIIGYMFLLTGKWGYNSTFWKEDKDFFNTRNLSFQIFLV